MCGERLICVRKTPYQRGLTLSELLIAMGLTSAVALMLLAAARVQTSIQRQEGQTHYVQDNVRSALEDIVQNVRRAGTSFISLVAVNAVPPHNPQRLSAITVLNSSTAPDVLHLVIIDDSATGTLMQNSDQYTNPLLVNNALGMTQGSLFTLTNFNHAILYQLAQNPTPTVHLGIPVFALRVTPPPVAPPAPMFRGSIVNRASLLSYRIDTTVIPGMPVLVLQDGAPLNMASPPEIVAENIEDLQVSIGVDGLTNGVADGRITEVGKAANDDEWVFNFAGETMPMTLPKGSVVAAVRITVVGRTATAESQLGPGRPAVEDRAAGPPDGFRRRLLTTQVAVRSMVTN
ncbi:MAG: PilW family protein [Myxococcales bacterium]|nr:PilW family protein [Myxococcota bacterium]MDW8282555.1 PilW family protein [Myxococcales bacterium]